MDKAIVLPAERRKRVLIVMFIRCVARDGVAAIDHDSCVGEALELFGRVFGGATAYPKASGVWRDDERGGELVKDEPVVFHCYTEPDVIEDLENQKKLARRSSR